MNLRQIEAFRAVMMFGTMTAAARELHTSQPSISRLVTELEERLQFKLFVRGASRLTPTDEGSAFYREVEHSFSGLAYLNQAAHEIRVSGTGREVRARCNWSGEKVACNTSAAASRSAGGRAWSWAVLSRRSYSERYSGEIASLIMGA